MQCEYGKAIMHTACIGESKDSPKKTKVYQKICQSQAGFRIFLGKQAVEREQIHWQTAKLKWKIPPVVRTAIADIQKNLLSKL